MMLTTDGIPLSRIPSERAILFLLNRLFRRLSSKSYMRCILGSAALDRLRYFVG